MNELDSQMRTREMLEVPKVSPELAPQSPFFYYFFTHDMSSPTAINRIFRQLMHKLSELPDTVPILLDRAENQERFTAAFDRFTIGTVPSISVWNENIDFFTPGDPITPASIALDDLEELGMISVRKQDFAKKYRTMERTVFDLHNKIKERGVSRVAGSLTRTTVRGLLSQR